MFSKLAVMRTTEIHKIYNTGQAMQNKCFEKYSESFLFYSPTFSTNLNFVYQNYRLLFSISFNSKMLSQNHTLFPFSLSLLLF